MFDEKEDKSELSVHKLLRNEQLSSVSLCLMQAGERTREKRELFYFLTNGTVSGSVREIAHRRRSVINVQMYS